MTSNTDKKFRLLDLKNFITLFPNSSITDVNYKKQVNDYIISKLVNVKNMSSISADSNAKKKEYINTYIIPLMNIVF